MATLTPFEYNVLKAMTRRWQTTDQIAHDVDAQTLWVASALYYLHLTGKIERKAWREGLSKWRKRG